jgi:hypothetical protein
LAGQGLLREGRGDRERKGRSIRACRRGLGRTGSRLAAGARQRPRRSDQPAACVGLLLPLLPGRARESQETPEPAQPRSARLPVVLALPLVPQRGAGVRERRRRLSSPRVPDRPVRVDWLHGSRLSCCYHGARLASGRSNRGAGRLSGGVEHRAIARHRRGLRGRHRGRPPREWRDALRQLPCQGHE